MSLSKVSLKVDFLLVFVFVTPLIKKSLLPPNDLKNYRPVSGLGFILKLVERVVASQLDDHVSLNRLENVRQFVHKLGHSTESALLSIKNDVHLTFAKDCCHSLGSISSV